MVVDGVFLLCPAGTALHGDTAQFFALNGRNVPAHFGPHGICFFGPCQRTHADPCRIAALSRHESAEFLKSGAVFNKTVQSSLPGSDGGRFSRRHKHLCPNLLHYFHEPSAAPAGQRRHGFIHLEAVADGHAERRVHRRNDGRRRPPRSLACPDHRLRQFLCFLYRLHEGAVTVFHVEDDGIRPGSELLAHDGCGDEGDAFDRSRRIAQSVQQLVRRRQIRRLADNGYAEVVYLSKKFILAENRAEARNRFELVYRAARKTEAAAAHLGDLHACRRNKRSHDECRRIGNAAGTVFVHLDPADRRQIYRVSRLGHSPRKGRRFRIVHPPQINGHEPCCRLVVGNTAARIIIDKTKNRFSR